MISQLKFVIKNKVRGYPPLRSYLTIKNNLFAAKQKYWHFPLFLKKKLPIDYLLIELSSVCNLDCKWCIIEKKDRGFMDLILFESILHQIVKKEVICKEISLNGGGEILLHPKFKKLLNIILKFKADNKNFPLVTLVTNATLLNKEKSNDLLSHKIIDVIRFSVDGGNKEDFEKIRIGAKWENIIKNINTFIDLNKQKGKPVHTSIISVMGPTMNVSSAFSKLIKRVDEYLPRRPHTWTGEKIFNDLQLADNQNQSFCQDIFRSLLIHWNGSVSPCCVDLNAKGIIGNLKKNSLKEVIYGKAKYNLVKNMYLNKRSKNKLCQKCSF